MITIMDLTLAVVEHPGDIEAALAAYETAMFPRAEACAAASAANLDLAFQPDAPQGFQDLLGGYLAEG